MILTTAAGRIERPINNAQDALVFADAYTADPAALFELVNARIEGEGAELVREALLTYVYAMGNSSVDALAGLLNVIHNAPWIVESPHLNNIAKVDVPAIAVACGPSLADYLDELRELQKSCLIVCADTAIGGLRKHGIFPQVATPVERYPELTKLVAPGSGMTYAGSLVTCQSIPMSFDHRLCLPGNEPLGRWVDPVGIGYGSSTGTAAVAVALSLTTGPVYLLGHDLSYGEKEARWKDASGPAQEADYFVEGNNGKRLPTNKWLKFYRDQISVLSLLTHRVFDPNIRAGKGARIIGAEPRYLPEPGQEFFWTRRVDKEPCAWRLNLPARIDRLCGDLVRAIKHITAATTADDLGIAAICGGENREALLSLFRPIYTQFSFEKRMGTPSEQIISGVKAAMLSVLAGSLPQIEQAIYG